MSPRARRLALIVAAAIAFLFAGRWFAGLYADRWWAGAISPAAGAFLTQLRVLRLVLDVGGTLVATAWLTGHFVHVVRAIAAVQVSRNVANLEIREAVKPRTLLWAAVAVGVVFGLLSGADLSDDWDTIALAWQGLRFGVVEPYLGQDLGVYVAQLPFWQLLHSFALLLVLVALGTVISFYLGIGAIRWMEGRLAITDHARRHLGWLFGAFAIALTWGYLLEPLEWVAGGAAAGRVPFALVEIAAPLLAGAALAAAIVSVVWGYRARHLMFAGTWLLLALGSVTGHYILPALRGGRGEAVRDAAIERTLETMSADLGSLQDSALVSHGPPGPPPSVPSFWSPETIEPLFARDSGRIVAMDAADVGASGAPVPAWLVLRALPGGRAVVHALRDDRISADGLPLAAVPNVTTAPTEPVAELPIGSVHPRAPETVVGAGAQGPRAGSWTQRVILAWALQTPELLGSVAAGTPVGWLLSPAERLDHLAPFADWDTPVLRLIEGRPTWLCYGYLTAATFPLVPRLPWRQWETGFVRPAYLGIVDAASGDTRIVARPGAGPLAEAWTALSGGLVEPASSLPDAVARVAPYPARFFQVQALAIERRDLVLGRLAAHAEGDGTAPPTVGVAWRDGGAVPAALTVFQRTEVREVSALLEGRLHEGREVLTLWRLPAAPPLLAPSALKARWDRFATFIHVRDSVHAARGELVTGPVQFAFAEDRAVALQVTVAWNESRPPAVVWVSAAADDRPGAGRTYQQAWDNLRDRLPPLPLPAAGAGPLADARHWMQLADSALKRGDLAGLARALDGLRQALGAGSVTPR